MTGDEEADLDKVQELIRLMVELKAFTPTKALTMKILMMIQKEDTEVVIRALTEALATICVTTAKPDCLLPLISHVGSRFLQISTEMDEIRKRIFPDEPEEEEKRNAH